MSGHRPHLDGSVVEIEKSNDTSNTATCLPWQQPRGELDCVRDGKTSENETAAYEEGKDDEHGRSL
jgi:hypothetical protein